MKSISIATARLRLLYAAIVTLAVGTLGVGSIASAEARASHTDIHELRDSIQNFANRVEMRTLPNGLRVIAVQRGDAPVFGGAVIVRVGGSDELPGHTGIAHMFEHMAFKGSSRLGTKDFAREKPLLAELEEIAARTDGGTKLTEETRARWDAITVELKSLWEPDAFTQEYDRRGAVGMNATTSADLTSYFVGLPVNSFEFWAAMEADRLIDPVMRQFYQERDVVMEERRMRTDNSGPGRLYEQLLQTAFTTHPYRNPVIGYPHDIARLTATETERFRRRFYVPENIAVAVVGAIEPRKIFRVVERYFGVLPAGSVERNTIPVEPRQKDNRKVRVEYPAEPTAFLAFHKPVYPERDAIALFVAAEILAGGSPTAILHRELVEQQRVASSVAAFEVPAQAYSNLLLFEIDPKPPFTNQQALARLRRTLAKVSRADVERLFEPARKGLLVGELGKWRSNVGLAQDLAATEVMYGSWRASLEQIDLLLSLTAGEVHSVIRRYLVGAPETAAVLERPRSGSPREFTSKITTSDITSDAR